MSAMVHMNESVAIGVGITECAVDFPDIVDISIPYDLGHRALIIQIKKSIANCKTWMRRKPVSGSQSCEDSLEKRIVFEPYVLPGRLYILKSEARSPGRKPHVSRRR